MKRIILLALVSLSVGMNALAQEKTKKNEVKAMSASIEANNAEVFKKNAVNLISQLDEYVGLDETMKNDFMNLIYMRNDAINNVTSQEDKKAVFTKYTMKLVSALNEKQIQILEIKYPEFYKNLTEYQPQSK